MSVSAKAGIRIAETIDDMTRLAVWLDNLGDYKSADWIDQTVKTASRIMKRVA